MGQYYKPINIRTMEWVYSHSYGSGLKLMEHSYVGNEFVGTVMALLTPGGDWYKAPIVWCGDYYDEDGEIPYFSMVKDVNEIKINKPMSGRSQTAVILVNHTKMEYVDFKELICNNSWIVNPLPLLTALGNNRGGGDYPKQNKDFKKVGIWAGDNLSVETEIPYGFWHLNVNFEEN